MSIKVKAGEAMRFSHEPYDDNNINFICDYQNGERIETISPKNLTFTLDGKDVPASFDPESNTWKPDEVV